MDKVFSLSYSVDLNLRSLEENLNLKVFTHPRLVHSWQLSLRKGDLNTQILTLACANKDEHYHKHEHEVEDAKADADEGDIAGVLVCAAAIEMCCGTDSVVEELVCCRLDCVHGCWSTRFPFQAGRKILTVWVSMLVDSNVFARLEAPPAPKPKPRSRAPAAALREERYLCDVTLIVDHQDLPAHRAILMACSAVFKAMLTSDMREKEDKTVVITGISLKAMTAALRFLYTGEVDTSHTPFNVELLDVAERYELNELKELLEEALTIRVNDSKDDVELAMDLLPRSAMYSLQTLMAACEFVLATTLMAGSNKSVRTVDVFFLASECEAWSLRKMMLVRLATLPVDLIFGWEEFAENQPRLALEVMQARMRVQTCAGVAEEKEVRDDLQLDATAARHPYLIAGHGRRSRILYPDDVL